MYFSPFFQAYPEENGFNGPPGIVGSFPKDFGYGTDDFEQEMVGATADNKPRILLMGLRRLALLLPFTLHKYVKSQYFNNFILRICALQMGKLNMTFIFFFDFSKKKIEIKFFLKIFI